jgi:hypothetical protein
MAKDKKSKASKETPGPKGEKKSKLPKPVRSRGFAIVGLLALAPIAWLLLKGRLDLTAAAQRAGLVLVGLMLIERLVAPVIMAVLESSRPEKPKHDEETKV